MASICLGVNVLGIWYTWAVWLLYGNTPHEHNWSDSTKIDSRKKTQWLKVIFTFHAKSPRPYTVEVCKRMIYDWYIWNSIWQNAKFLFISECCLDTDWKNVRLLFSISLQLRFCLHFDEIVVTDCTGSCHIHNFPYSHFDGTYISA